MPASTYPDNKLNDSSDWDLLVTSRLNAILCGDQKMLDVTLSILVNHLDLPVREWSGTEGLPLPPIASGTLMVADLAGATLDQQRVLLAWLDGHDAVRVITVCLGPLFGLVGQGLLLEGLYYRLNPMYFTLSPDCPFWLTEPGAKHGGAHASPIDRAID